MPSPSPEQPGLLIRDPYQYSDRMLLIPPVLVQCLRFFDGESAENDLREFLVRLTGQLQVSEAITGLRTALEQAGFLEDGTYLEFRGKRYRSFAAAEVRESTLAGGAYPEQSGALNKLLDECLAEAPQETPPGNLIGIAAPHVSLEGGGACYGSAYGALPPDYRERVFVILGTSHYGENGRFGLTRKPFRTPLGDAQTETSLVDRLVGEAPDAAVLEDYCHAIEHSIEFQVVFLQRLFGPQVRILPVLCGSFAHSLEDGSMPEGDPAVRQFLETLKALAQDEGSRLSWVLGIDLAHMGRRYGDSFSARAGEGLMDEVRERDLSRLQRVCEGDPQGFWGEIQNSQRELKWCGAAPLYTFMSAVPGTRAQLLRYEQWNIDPDSVVSFAALALTR